MVEEVVAGGVLTNKRTSLSLYLIAGREGACGSVRSDIGERAYLMIDERWALHLHCSGVKVHQRHVCWLDTANNLSHLRKYSY